MSGLARGLRLLSMSRSVRQFSNRSVLIGLSKRPIHTPGLFSNEISASQVIISFNDR